MARTSRRQPNSYRGGRVVGNLAYDERYAERRAPRRESSRCGSVRFVQNGSCSSADANRSFISVPPSPPDTRRRSFLTSIAQNRRRWNPHGGGFA